MELSRQGLMRNQALLREVNERINEIRSDLSEPEFICECSHPECTTTIQVPQAQYEAIRSNAHRFVVARGHERTDVEKVARDEGAFFVVEKTRERDFFLHTDPRSREERDPDGERT